MDIVFTIPTSRYTDLPLAELAANGIRVIDRDLPRHGTGRLTMDDLPEPSPARSEITLTGSDASLGYRRQVAAKMSAPA
jgi:hypothetical protein